MGYTNLIQIIAALILNSLLGLAIAPNILFQLKEKKIETITIKTQEAIYDAIIRYMLLENIKPNTLSDLISKNYLFNYTDNGFGDNFTFEVDEIKGLITIYTVLEDENIRNLYINSYKNRTKPEITTGNQVKVIYNIPNSIINKNSKFETSILIQPNEPNPSINKYWYDSSVSGKPILKMSNGTKWKVLSENITQTELNSLGTISNGIDSLSYDSSLKNGDTKTIYQNNNIETYTYYNGKWYRINN